MTDETRSRQWALRYAGVAATMGTLAGCAGGGSGSEGNGSASTEAETTTAVPFDAETETPASTTASEGSSSYLQPAPETVDQWLLDQNPFYDGNMVVGIPYVGVGAGEADTGFDPAAVKISTGTEITWEWASADKPHNVVQIAQTGTEEAAFDSGEPQQGNNITFRYTFEEAGIYRYVCTPHRQQTGRGAIVVVDEPVGIGGEANASENASEGGNASAGTNGTTTGTTMGTETEPETETSGG